MQSKFVRQAETGKCDPISREKSFNWGQSWDDSKVLELEDKDFKYYNYTWGSKEKYAGSERGGNTSQLRNWNDKNMNYMEILELKKKYNSIWFWKFSELTYYQNGNKSQEFMNMNINDPIWQRDNTLEIMDRALGTRGTISNGLTSMQFEAQEERK